jgi:tetratricopeptide (TPR) repeat protein
MYRAFVQQSDQVSLYNKLGLVYIILGNLGRGETSLRKALLLNPGYALAHNKLDAVMAWEGDYAKAPSTSSTGGKIMPRYYSLAECYLEMMR